MRAKAKAWPKAWDDGLLFGFVMMMGSGAALGFVLLHVLPG
jgi:hypothetical protein